MYVWGHTFAEDKNLKAFKISYWSMLTVPSENTPGQITNRAQSCHHQYNSDTIHAITTGVQEKRLPSWLGDLDAVEEKFKATYPIGGFLLQK